MAGRSRNRGMSLDLQAGRRGRKQASAQSSVTGPSAPLQIHPGTGYQRPQCDYCSLENQTLLNHEGLSQKSNSNQLSDTVPDSIPTSNPVMVLPGLLEISCPKGPQSWPCTVPTGCMIPFKATPSFRTEQGQRLELNTIFF